MFKRDRLTSKMLSSLLLALTAVFTLVLGGCGDDNSSHRAATNDTVLISAATLQEWIDDGRVNNDQADEVVILDVTTSANFTGRKHIPGALLWNYGADLTSNSRPEGPMTAPYMVIDGAKMDAMLDLFGIEADSTIVITSSDDNSFRPARAYWTLRYWGFPKERLKVLNGFNGAWDAADLTDETVTVNASGYTVAELAGYNADLRMSLTDMMDAVANGDVVPFDMRGDLSTYVAGDSNSGYAYAFTGRLKGGKFFSQKGFNEQYDAIVAQDGTVLSAKDMSYRSVDEIVSMLASAGVDGSRKLAVYCTSGYNAAAGFLVLDGILGWDVTLYDGSFLQWGNLSEAATGENGDLIAENAHWATDVPSLMANISYAPDTVTVNLRGGTVTTQLDLVDGNQIEDADYAYVFGN